MGIFLSISGVIGKSENEVLESLASYAVKYKGGFNIEALSFEDDNCGVADTSNGNTSILYPDNFTDWDRASAHLSKELKTTVFSFHIHDGDFWMYIMYHEGEIADRFNPIPDYWEEDLSGEDFKSWRGNAATITKYISYIKPKDISRYLVRWDLENEEESKAYPGDEFSNEDWQLLDFMKKLRLPYPLDENGDAKGKTFKLWIEDNEAGKKPNNKSTPNTSSSNKPWWKIW